VPRKSPYVIKLTDHERRELESRARRYTLPYREVMRAKIVLLAAKGLDNHEIAERLHNRREPPPSGTPHNHAKVCGHGTCSLRRSVAHSLRSAESATCSGRPGQPAGLRRLSLPAS